MRHRQTGREGGPELITAAEIACHAYCPEQWRLEYGLELLPSNRAEMAAGNRHHARKAAAERVAGESMGIGWLLAVAVKNTAVCFTAENNAAGAGFAGPSSAGSRRPSRARPSLSLPA